MFSEAGGIRSKVLGANRESSFFLGCKVKFIIFKVFYMCYST